MEELLVLMNEFGSRYWFGFVLLSALLGVAVYNSVRSEADLKEAYKKMLDEQREVTARLHKELMELKRNE